MKRYSFPKFILDVILVVLTGGLWVIWIFCREMRRPRSVYQYEKYPTRHPYNRY